MQTLESLENTIASETAIPEIGLLNVEQIQAMIEKLSTTDDGVNLKTAMHQLKGALLANPAASSLLLPTDVGQMVTMLRKMTDKEIVEAMIPKGKKGKDTATIDIKKLDKTTLDNLSVEDLN